MSSHSQIDRILGAVSATELYIPRRLYVLDGYYSVIECEFLTGAFSVIVYLPRASIPAGTQTASRLVEIETERIEVNTAYPFEDLESIELSKRYPEIDIIKTDNINESTLEDLYNRPVVLSSNRIPTATKSSVYVIRQLERFSRMVMSIDIKLGLYDEDCLCLVNPENKIETYTLKGVERGMARMYACIKLSHFLKYIETVHTDCKELFSQVYKTLDNNHVSEMSILKKFGDKIRESMSVYSKIQDTKATKLAQLRALETEVRNLHYRKVSIQKQISTLGDTHVSTDETEKTMLKLNNELDLTARQIPALNGKYGVMRKQYDEYCIKTDMVLYESSVLVSKVTEYLASIDKIVT